MKQLHQLILMTIFLLVAQSDGFGQDSENEGVFAFAFNKFGSYATDASIPDKKIEKATRVFNMLVEAKGVKNMRRPTFIMQNAERRPAWTKPGDAIVVLEEKAYDICIETGKDSMNALAALLAHELIHYYEKHDWKQGFTHQIAEMSTGSSTGRGTNDLDLEFQADYMGGLLAHMAGYQTLGVMPELLKKIYDGYHLSELAEGAHPSLKNRKVIAQNSDLLLTKYSRIFDMSLYMTAIGQYDLARQYLDFLLVKTQFQSREIYNNIGVLSLLSAIDLFSADELKYHYPVELELTTRMSTRAGAHEMRTVLLEDALYNFKNASILDEAFSTAFLNLSTAYLLQNKVLDASYYAQKALEGYTATQDSHGISEANVLLGIIAAVQGESDKASDLFIAANSVLGRNNLCILKGRDECGMSPERNTNNNSNIVDGVNLNQLYARIMQDKEQALLSIDIDEQNSFHSIAKPNSEILLNLNHNIMGDYTFFQLVNSPGINYQGVLEVGSSYDDVVGYFGQPSNEFCANDKCILNFNNHNLLLNMGQNRIVEGWILYKSNFRK